MKNKLKSIATVFALVLMFSIFGTSVLADVVSVTEKIQLSWRGNGSVSSYNADEVSIGKNEDVTLQTRVTCTLDPNTVKHWVTAIAELRVTRWYGYDTIIKETLCNASPMLNNDDDTKVYSYYTSKN